MKHLACLFLLPSLFYFSFVNYPIPGLARLEKQSLASSYTIQRKGQTISASKVNGSILRPFTQTNSYFNLDADFQLYGRHIAVAIYLRNQDDLTVGKVYSLAGNGNLEKDSKKPRTILYVEFEKNAADDSKTITSGSESGTLIFSSINISKQKAIVSGRFEFKGRNHNSHPSATKEISVKGNFSNIEINVIPAGKSRK